MLNWLYRHWKLIEFFGIVFNALYKVISHARNKDKAAMQATIEEVLTIEKTIKKLEKEQRFPQRREDSDEIHINQIEAFLINAQKAHSTTLVSIPELQILVSTALNRISEWREDPHLPHNVTCFVGVDLREILIPGIENIKPILHVSLLKRIHRRMRSKSKPQETNK